MRAPRTNASGWAKAGRDAASSFISIFDTTRKYAPRYDELAEVGIKQRSQEKQAAIKAESLARRAEIKAETQIEKTKISVDEFNAKQKAKGTIRKAGLVAAAGSAIGLALTPDEEPIRPETLNYDDFIDKAKSKLGEAKDNLANFTPSTDSTESSTTKDTDTKPAKDTGTSGNSTATGGGTAGKASQPLGGGNAWKPLSAVIRYAEGTSGDKGYTTQFTGTQFSDMSRHPRQLRKGGGYTSDAAGAYQFLSTTWDEASKALNLPDFSPESQEKAGRYLAETKRGANLSKVAGNIDEFRSLIDKLAPEWAGLPYSGVSPGGFGRGSSYYGQGGKKLEDLYQIYQQNL